MQRKIVAIFFIVGELLPSTPALTPSLLQAPVSFSFSFISRLSLTPHNSNSKLHLTSTPPSAYMRSEEGEFVHLFGGGGLISQLLFGLRVQYTEHTHVSGSVHDV